MSLNVLFFIGGHLWAAWITMGMLGCAKITPFLSPAGQAAVGKTDAPKLVVSLPHVLDRAFKDLAAAFQQQYPGLVIEKRLGLIREVIEQIQNNQVRSDVFLCIGEWELEPLKKADLLVPDSERIFASTPLAVLLVKGNPLGLKSLQDLARPEVKTITIPDITFNSAGHYFVEAMQNLGLWEQIRGKVVEKPNPKDATTLVEENKGSDACVTYSSCYVFGHANTTHLLEFIPSNLHEPIRCPGVLVRGGVNLEWGKKFLDFLGAEEAQDIWEKWGFIRVHPKPQESLGKSLLVPCGAGLRDAMNPIGEAYQEKTGVRVDFAYSGGGILLAQLAFSKVGDLYMPGELFYLQQAEQQGLVLDKRIACYFVPVLAVQKGNPKGLQSLKDLARPGLEVGLGDPQSLAVGLTTQRILDRAGIREAVEKNVVFRGGCVPELVNALKLKTIDAAILWDTTAFQNREDVDTIEISKEWNEVAVVPIGVLRCARDVEAARRFMEFVVSPEAQAIFQAHGYTTEKPEGLITPSL